jgi:hypothetical protein
MEPSGHLRAQLGVPMARWVPNGKVMASTWIRRGDTWRRTLLDGNRFDRITRSLATGTSRRSLVHAMAAGVIGGAAALLPGSGVARRQRALDMRLADLDTEEQSVVLYEALAELADSHTGNCGELGDATQQLLLANADVLDAIRGEQDPGTKRAGWTTFRRTVIASRALLGQCTSPGSGAAIGRATVRQPPRQQALRVSGPSPAP